MQEKLFTGFENANRYRSYPFSEMSLPVDQDGVTLPSDVFIDAILYPVNSVGRIRMSLFDCSSGRIEFSDDNGAIAIGVPKIGDKTVWLYDTLNGVDPICSDRPIKGRPVGTVACGPGFDRELSTGRIHSYSGAFLSPSAVCPIAYSGVKSIRVVGNITTALECLESSNPSDILLEDRNVGIVGEGNLVCRMSGNSNKMYMWFDVLQPYSKHSDVTVYEETKTGKKSNKKPKVAIKSLSVAVLGKSLFNVDCIGDDDVLVTMETLDREDICYQANREAISSKAKIDICPDVEYDKEGMACNPDEGGEGDPTYKDKSCVFEGVSDVGLLSPDFANYKNPVWIGGDSDSSSHTNYPKITYDMSIESATSEIQKLHKNPVSGGNTLEIAIPGAGGM